MMKKPKVRVADFIKGIGENIQIGHYEIRKLSDGSFFIEHDSGEGGQFSADSLEAAITQFYADNF